MQDYASFHLKSEFERRKAKNSSYSIRAFANYLGVGIATLSDLFNGKRGLSPKNRVKIAEKLKLSPVEREQFLNSKVTGEDRERLELEDGKFRLISDWYHYAILELSYVKDHKASVAWIAKKLGVAKEVIRDGLTRLEKSELLKIKAGKLVQTTPSLKTSDNVPSVAIKKRHCEILEMAQEAVENCPVDKRYFYEITTAINPDQIEEAEKMMLQAIRKIAKKLENGERKEVYSLGIQLFPLKKNN